MFYYNRIVFLSLVVLSAIIGLSEPAAVENQLAWAAPFKLPVGVVEKKIIVDLSEQLVTAYQDGSAVMRFPASTGRNDNTAAGSFRILDKRLRPINPQWGYSMPNWMGIYWVGEMENGIHALPVTEDGRELWGNLIGSPASDGCVVLRAEHMQKLYDWAEVDTPVEIIE